jgi:hypothetical protein
MGRESDGLGRSWTMPVYIFNSVMMPVDPAYNTPCYGSPNLSLITIISGLVMHYVLELINSESSQMDF